MIKLYFKLGACSLAPHIVLEWIGEPYETEQVDPTDPEFKKLNPSAAVPVLDTGEGWTLTQDGAVLQYLARRFPEADLGVGDSPREQAELEQWSSFVTGDLHPSFGPIFNPKRYTSAPDQAALDAVKEAAVGLVRKRYAILNDHLNGKEHMLAGKRTILDAYIFPMLRWGNKILPDGLDRYPDLHRFHDMLAADPVAQKVMKDEGLM
jgi:glutathione S-transferase